MKGPMNTKSANHDVHTDDTIKMVKENTGHRILLPLLLLLVVPAVAQAQFTYETNNGTITITGYTGPGGAEIIPSTIAGLAGYPHRAGRVCRAH